METKNKVTSFKTLREAKKAAKVLRASGQSVKIYRHSRIATVPFVGVRAFVSYEIKGGK